MGKQRLNTNTGDVLLAHASITFIVLCKIKRFKEAEPYLETITNQFNSIVKGRKSRINSTGLSNLYCLIHLSIELIRVLKGFDLSESIESCKSALNNVRRERTAAITLLERFTQCETQLEGIEILQSDEFQSVLYITTFFPFIGPHTPIIDFTELCKSQEKARADPLSKEDVPYIIAPNTRENEDIYSLIMKNALKAVKRHN